MAKKKKKTKVKSMTPKTKEKTSTPKTKMLALKEWLEDNKIIFETLMTTALTIMGIWVSIVSSHYEKVALNLQEAQALVEEQLNMPVFNVYRDYVSEENENGTSVWKSTDIQVINTGGNISNGYLSAKPTIEVVMCDEFHNQISVIALELWGMYEKSYSHYNPENKKFEITEVKTDNDFQSWELVSFLEKSLREDFPDSYFSVLYNEYINIVYSDFKGELHDEWYIMGVGDLYTCRVHDAEVQSMIWIEEMTFEEIYMQVNESLVEVLSEIDSENEN